jgi:WXG100 family type VII secretion target
MANYNIVVAEAETVVEDMSSANQQLRTSLETLMTSINAFTAANNGNAPDAYATAQSDWNTGQQTMNQSLTTGQARLSEIIAGYVRGDQQGAGVFS